MREMIRTTAFLRRLQHRMASLFQNGSMERSMAEEMRLHIEMQAAEYRAQGLDSDEATAKALRVFGHVDGINERCRDERGFPWISHLGQDLRYGLRMLARSPGFTFCALLALALGIGANTAIFSLIDEILLRQMPVGDPAALVLFHWATHDDFRVPVGGSWEFDEVTKQETCTSFSLPTFERFRKTGEMAGVFAFASLDRITVVADGRAESVPLGELVSGDCFSVLGLPPAVGRTIVPADDRPGAAPVAMISYGYWQRRFDGSPDVIGRSITVNRLPVTVIGIAPPHFYGTLQVGDNPDLYLPLSLAAALGAIRPEVAERPGVMWWLQIIGRLRPDHPIAHAVARLEPILQQCSRESLAENGLAATSGLPSLIAGPGGQGLSEIRHEYAKEWAILAALGTAVLAVACANVANLLLARGASRRREMGVRLAMGAGRARIVRQLLTESALLATIGGMLAVPVAVWSEHALLLMQPKLEGHALGLSPSLDLRVFGIAALISALTGLAFGLVPALRSSCVDINAEFQGGTNNRGAGIRSALGRSFLVAQVALSLVLLVGAGLFGRTLRNLGNVDIGFDRSNLLIFDLDPNPSGDNFKAASLKNGLVAERLRSLPGVLDASYSKMPVLAGAGWNTSVRVEGAPVRSGGPDSAMVNAVGPGFFATYGIPIILGRAPGARDEDNPKLVAVINQHMAKAFFGDESPLGRILVQPGPQGKMETIEVIGVARDASYSGLRNDIPPTLYFPFSVAGRSARATFAVRTAAQPLSIVTLVREAVASVDPLIPVADVRTQAAQIDDLSANERMFAQLSGIFSLLALGLVSLGLYGLMSYSVQRRTSEIGLRMALGARPRGVVWMILRESLVVVAIGVLIGIVGAWAASRAVAAMMFGMSAADPLTFAGCAILLLVVAVLAGGMPAWRASRLDPMVALRRD